jgi:hypothetical protein
MAIELKIAVDDIFSYESIPDDTILRQDMYQSTYQHYAIDCGWYQSDEGDRFITYLIKDYNWEEPVIKIETKEFNDAKWGINICKEYMEKIFV